MYRKSHIEKARKEAENKGTFPVSSGKHHNASEKVGDLKKNASEKREKEDYSFYTTSLTEQLSNPKYFKTDPIIYTDPYDVDYAPELPKWYANSMVMNKQSKMELRLTQSELSGCNVASKIMSKMGWVPGTRLGKNVLYGRDDTNNIVFDFKNNRGGLGKPEKRDQKKIEYNEDGEIVVYRGSTNPVAILNNYCQCQKVMGPKYTKAEDENTKKGMFVYSVVVFGQQFKPDKGRLTIKEAKNDAAREALKSVKITN